MFFLFIFCIPIASIGEPITHPLRRLVAAIVVLVCNNLLGMNVQGEGTQLFNSAHTYSYEVAAACSGLRSLTAVLRVDPGFHSSGVLTVELHSPAGNDPLDPPRFQEMVQALEAIPGVEAACGISRYFQANVQVGGEVSIVGRTPANPSHQTSVNYDVIAGDYLRAIGVPDGTSGRRTGTTRLRRRW